MPSCSSRGRTPRPSEYGESNVRKVKEGGAELIPFFARAVASISTLRFCYLRGSTSHILHPRSLLSSRRLSPTVGPTMFAVLSKLQRSIWQNDQKYKRVDRFDNASEKDQAGSKQSLRHVKPVIIALTFLLAIYVFLTSVCHPSSLVIPIHLTTHRDMLLPSLSSH
jgi:hypothetical protein